MKRLLSSKATCHNEVKVNFNSCDLRVGLDPRVMSCQKWSAVKHVSIHLYCPIHRQICCVLLMRGFLSQLSLEVNLIFFTSNFVYSSSSPCASRVDLREFQIRRY